MKKAGPTRVVLMIGTLALALGVFDAVAAGPGTVTMTVTAVGQKDTSPPLVTKDDVQLFLNKERTQVADWKHGEKLYLAVLIDDSLDSEIASQWSDLKAFLAGQPDTAYISVAYACWPRISLTTTTLRPRLCACRSATGARSRVLISRFWI